MSYQHAFLEKNIKIGEFLWSHFNTEDGRENNIFDTLCFTISRKVKSQLKCKEKICAVYEQTCRKWFAKFHARRFSLDDSPESGRLVEAGSDQNQDINWEQSTLHYEGESRHT